MWARKGPWECCGTPAAWAELRRAGRGAGICCLVPLGRQGEAHAVVGHVKDGVIFPEENVSQDPEGLPVQGGQVGDLDAQGAVAIAL